MRTHIFFLIHTVACLIGGTMVALALSQSGALQVGLIAGGLLPTAAFVGWGLWKFTGIKRQMVQFRSNATAASCGFSDIDEALRGILSENGSASEPDATTELNEVKDILDKVDRRKGAVDRDGRPLSSAARLVGILKGYGNTLSSNIHQANSCGRELQRAIEEIVSGSEAQSDLMNRTTTVVEEMSAHIISVCDNAEQAMEASAGFKSNAETGLQHIRDLNDEMKRFRKFASARERKIQQLAQHTREIESIVQTIGSLSSRTDLLALNASIESVRAGEHGRGFAVVAEEVRALAEQSAQAVLDITRRLEMIQLETHQSGSQQSDQDQIQSVMQRVSDTLNSLEDICDSAEQSTNGLDDISANSNKQLLLAQQIVEALEQGTDSTQKNRSRAEGAHWTAKSLGEASDQLNDSLDLFRLSGAIDDSSNQSNASAPTVS
ncbi:MAG: methyl-accepting chemotaxis protein [Planctomycetota bacterium]